MGQVSVRNRKENNNNRQVKYEDKGERVIDFKIIWGDFNDNDDNTNVIDCFVTDFNFKKDNIYQCFSVEKFKDQVQKLSQKNVIVIKSWGFAMSDNEGTIQWIEERIQKKASHCRSIIIFTSEHTINKQQLNLKELQAKYPSITALEYDNQDLYKSIDRVIYNQYHIPFDLVTNLNLYFNDEDFKFNKVFGQSLTFDILKYKKYLSIGHSKVQQLIKMINKIDVESPLVKYKNNSLIEAFITNLASCFEPCAQNNINRQITQEEIINNLIRFYSQESDAYKIINWTLCTLNPKIYDQMKPIYKLFSAALAKYSDNNQLNQLKLYRGSLISKQLFSQFIEQYKINKSNNLETFILFPAFLSTSQQEIIAQLILTPQELKIVNTLKFRPHIIPQCYPDLDQKRKQFQKQQAEVRLINHDEKDQSVKQVDNNQFHKVIFNIDASFNLENSYRPKIISNNSNFSYEKEFLFQPFSFFRVLGFNEPTPSYQFYQIQLEYSQ